MTGGTHLDSPNTTSAITYNIAMRVQNAGSYWINRTGTDGDSSDAYHARSASGITVMEIAA